VKNVCGPAGRKEQQHQMENFCDDLLTAYVESFDSRVLPILAAPVVAILDAADRRESSAAIVAAALVKQDGAFVRE
jgi:hypothetical protein